MSTESSTNRADVGDVRAAGPREDGEQFAAPKPHQPRPVPATGTESVPNNSASNNSASSTAAANPSASNPSASNPSASKPSGSKRDRRGRRRRGRRNGDSRATVTAPDSPQRAGLNTPQQAAESVGPTPNDLARARARKRDPSSVATPEGPPADKRPDHDRARAKVSPPKPSDLVSVTAKITKTGLVQASKSSKNRRRPRPDRHHAERLRTVRETSAGGLVISDLDLPIEQLHAALIGRMDRRGRMMWSLPKGHIETGETAEQTAIREVAEETGIQGTVVAPLGKIDYWFVSEGKRIHKTVHHYLLRSVGGELSDEDYEVSEVAWVPLHELPRRLTYSDERRLARMARGVIADLAADPTRLARSEAESIRTEPNAYEKAAAARNQRRNEPAPSARSRRRRRRPRRPAAGDG